MTRTFANLCSEKYSKHQLYKCGHVTTKALPWSLKNALFPFPDCKTTAPLSQLYQCLTCCRYRGADVLLCGGAVFDGGAGLDPVTQTAGQDEALVHQQTNFRLPRSTKQTSRHLLLLLDRGHFTGNNNNELQIFYVYIHVYIHLSGVGRLLPHYIDTGEKSALLKWNKICG
jgi:hypothetical protein